MATPNERRLLLDCAIYFEFKHFKAKKNKISTKCFAFLEKDEIKDGALALELYVCPRSRSYAHKHGPCRYQKPVDYTKKKLCLLTEKKLFLHVTLTLQKAVD